VLRESKVTVKIPRPLYRKIQAVVEGSGFSSPTDFIVYVLRDLMGEASSTLVDAGKSDAAKAEPSRAEIEELKRKLKKLGYL
jgi:Arc/MetJ-type ribon-helix-helix transcriptional regulator